MPKPPADPLTPTLLEAARSTRSNVIPTWFRKMISDQAKEFKTGRWSQDLNAVRQDVIQNVLENWDELQFHVESHWDLKLPDDEVDAAIIESVLTEAKKAMYVKQMESPLGTEMWFSNVELQSEVEMWDYNVDILEER